MAVYIQIEKCYGRLEDDGYLTDFQINGAAFEVHEEDKDMVTLSFNGGESDLSIEMKTEDFLYFSRLLKKHLKLLEKPDGE